MRRLILLLTAASLVLSVLIVGPAGSAFAAGKIADGKKKGFICHATGSKKNPYVLIKVPKNSAHFTKHKADKEPIWVKDKLSCKFFPKKDDGKKDDGKKKKFICHATGSKTNPYVLIKPSKNSAHFTKHDDDKKPVWVKGKPSCKFPKKDGDKKYY